MPDLLAPHLPGLVASLQAEAPGIELSIRPVPAKLNDFLASQECALSIAPNAFAGSATIQRRLGQLKFGVLHRREHPLACGRLTLKRWLKYAHVVVSIENGVQNPISRALEELGETRKVSLQVPTFLAGLMVASRSDLIMNAPLSLVGESLERFDLVARPLPLQVPPLQLSIMWHAKNQRDQAHAWLRERVHDYFKCILDER
jgi:DNA-binding transcriptional LysR family regulator